MPAVVDLTGKQFGRWTVLQRGGRIGNHAAWVCKCSCPAKTEREVSSNSLRRGISLSCGCLQRESATTHGKHGTRIHRIWLNMVRRCTDPRHKSYSRYGARGITVSQEWLHSFETFLRDMGEPPTPLHTLDRRENNLGYSKENCRWASVDIQQNNKRTSTHIAFKGEVKSIAQWSRVLDIPEETIRSRLMKGWTIDLALTTPSPSRLYHSTQYD